MVAWIDECHILEELCSRHSHDELVKRSVIVLKWLALVRACVPARMRACGGAPRSRAAAAAALCDDCVCVCVRTPVARPSFPLTPGRVQENVLQRQHMQVVWDARAVCNPHTIMQVFEELSSFLVGAGLAAMVDLLCALPANECARVRKRNMHFPYGHPIIRLSPCARAHTRYVFPAWAAPPCDISTPLCVWHVTDCIHIRISRMDRAAVRHTRTCIPLASRDRPYRYLPRTLELFKNVYTCVHDTRVHCCMHSRVP